MMSTCGGWTRAGERCRRVVRAPNEYCHDHEYLKAMPGECPVCSDHTFDPASDQPWPCCQAWVCRTCIVRSGKSQCPFCRGDISSRLTASEMSMLVQNRNRHRQEDVEEEAEHLWQSAFNDIFGTGGNENEYEQEVTIIGPFPLHASGDHISHNLMTHLNSWLNEVHGENSDPAPSRMWLSVTHGQPDSNTDGVGVHRRTITYTSGLESTPMYRTVERRPHYSVSHTRTQRNMREQFHVHADPYARIREFIDRHNRENQRRI